MSYCSADIAKMKEAENDLRDIPGVISEIQSTLNSISKNLPLCLLFYRNSVKTVSGNLQKCITSTNKLTGSLEDIIDLYKTIEAGVRDSVGGVKISGLMSENTSGGSSAPAVDPLEGMSYEEIIEYRIDNAVDDNTKQLYEKYYKKIKIKDDNYTDTAHYNPFFNHINYSDEQDIVNERGPGSTYFHEVGHLVDDRSDFNGCTSTDWSYKFYDCIEDDIEDWLDDCMNRNGYTDREDAYEDLSEWLWNDPDMKNGISDIVNGVTEGQSSGRWIHDDDYYNKKSISQETFAHFFEAGMSHDPTKLEYIKEMFPSAYREYQKMLEDELK